MSSASPTTSNLGGGSKRPLIDDELTASGRSKSRKTPPLVGIGRHYERTIDMFTRPAAVLNFAALTLGGESVDESNFDSAEKVLWTAYRALCVVIPGLQDHILSDDGALSAEMANNLHTGMKGARADDTRRLKSEIIEWIKLSPGSPALHKNVKISRGFRHPDTGSLLCPARLDWDDPAIRAALAEGTATIGDPPEFVNGSHWPRFLYESQHYTPTDPFLGLLRNSLLVNAFKAIFTSPSSVDNEVGDNRATRSSNAAIHGMTQVTAGSLAYIAVQVSFALSSHNAFNDSPKTIDARTFYYSILDFLQDPVFQEFVDNLFEWWNRTIFSHADLTQRRGYLHSSLAELKASISPRAGGSDPPASPNLSLSSARL